MLRRKAMGQRRSFASILGFLLLLFCHSLTTVALGGNITAKRAEIGFAGKYKSGFWTPVTLTLVAGDQPVSGQLQLIAPDGDNVPVVFFASEATPSLNNVRLELGQETVLHSYVKVGPEKSRLSTRLVDPASGKVLWQSRLPDNLPAPLPATTPLVLTLGRSVGVDEALRFTRRTEVDAPVAAEVSAAADLPDQWWGYEGVEVIVLPTGSGGIVDQLSQAQVAALLQWVREGGRLVISVGARGEQILAANSPWQEVAPGQFATVVPLRDSSSLESLGGEAFPLTDDASRPPVTQLTNVRGKVELTQGARAAEVPLVVRTPHGFGDVVFVAFDLESERMTKWKGRPRFLASLLQSGERKKQEVQASASTARLGYADLTGQLRAALDQFPGVTPVSFTSVALLMLAYIALIGPLDFLLVRRAGIPRTITWGTFPLLALLFCGIAWYFAGWSHGSSLRLNQAEIVDIDAQRGVIRGTAWMHLYSPQTQSFDVELHPPTKKGDSVSSTAGYLVWQGLPGGGLGGLDAKQVAPGVIDPYEIVFPGPVPAIRSLPVQVGSSKSLAARWWGETTLAHSASLSLNEHGVPIGEVVNPLDVDLQECILTYNIWMYRLQTLHAGERFNLSDARPLYLEARLQQHTAMGAKDAATPWLRDSSDVPAILQMLMFHQAASGENYTGLTHRYQSHLDLSDHLKNGRALLVGRAAQPAAELHIAGSPLPAEQIQSWTYYRIGIPAVPAKPLTN